jgi:hypothetical protein
MKHSEKSPETGEVEEWYAIHEVFYRSDDDDDLLVKSDETAGYTVEPIKAVAFNLDDLRWRLEEILQALDKPVLEYCEDESPLVSDSIQ